MYVRHFTCTCISLSACLLQRQNVDYARVREYSLRVLQWRPGDVKALYRAGVATLEMGDAQTAKQYLSQACREQPNGEKRGHTSGSSHSKLRRWYRPHEVICFDISEQHISSFSPQPCYVFTNHFRWIFVSKEYLVPIGSYLWDILPSFFRLSTINIYMLLIILILFDIWLVGIVKYL